MLFLPVCCSSPFLEAVCLQILAPELGPFSSLTSPLPTYWMTYLPSGTALVFGFGLVPGAACPWAEPQVGQAWPQYRFAAWEPGQTESRWEGFTGMGNQELDGESQR